MAKSDRREEMRLLLKHRERHGLTYRELGDESGVPVHTLSWWAWKLRREERERTSFVEVEAAESCDIGVLEVEAPSGHVVRVRDNFDATALQRVLEVLASC